MPTTQTEYPIFAIGDAVMFTARQEDSVPYSCTPDMERTLYGKIFRVKDIRDDPDERTQCVYPECCDLTASPEECNLSSWSFSSQMFCLYEEIHEPEMTYEEFLMGA